MSTVTKAMNVLPTQ